MKSSDIKINSNGQIYTNNNLIGFLDGDRVNIFEKGTSREIGTFDHKSEVVSIVLDWFNGRR